MRPRRVASRDGRLSIRRASAPSAAAEAAAATAVEIQPTRELRRSATLNTTLPQASSTPIPDESPVSPVLTVCPNQLAPPFPDLSDDDESTRDADDTEDAGDPDESLPPTPPSEEKLLLPQRAVVFEPVNASDLEMSTSVVEPNRANSTSPGPSPDNSSNNMPSVLAVRMPDRPRSPIHGGATIASTQPLDIDRVERAAPVTQPSPLVHNAHITHLSRSPSPKRKFAVRAEHGSAAPSPHRRSSRARSRRSVMREDAAATQRAHAHLQHDQAAPQLEEDASARRAVPSEKLERDVATINQALRESISSADKAETVLMAIAKFALGPRSPSVAAQRRDALLAAGAVELVVEVQASHAASAAVQAVAAWAVGSLCHEDTSMQLAFGRAGAVEAVVDALRSHDESLWVIEFGLRALSALTWEPRNRDAIGSCGGLDVVIATMGRHADMCNIQADGATLLANSAFGHERNKALLANGFGLDAVVTAMRGFTHNATVQNHGCLALRNATWALERNKEIAGVKGSVNAVIDALDAHAADSAVVEQAAAALCIMVEGVPANVERMLNSSEWATVLLGALSAHAGVESVQVNLLKVLAAVARAHTDRVPALIAEGALDAALGAMRRNVTRRAVMLAGASAAKALLITGAPEAEAALQSAGGVTALLDMLYCSVTAPPISPTAGQAAKRIE